MYARHDYAGIYVRGAEYCQKKADGYRRVAAGCLREAGHYERDAAYIIKKGKAETAKCHRYRAKQAMDNYKSEQN